VVCPVRFLKTVERLRWRFDREEGRLVEPTVLRARGMPDAILFAAIAALVNEGFLRWTEDGRLVNARGPVAIPQRRTA
jgi:hypothetical protein